MSLELKVEEWRVNENEDQGKTKVGEVALPVDAAQKVGDPRRVNAPEKRTGILRLRDEHNLADDYLGIFE